MDFTSDAFRYLVARILMVVVIFGVAWLLRSALAWVLSRPLKSLLRRANADRAEDLNALIQSIVFIPVRYALVALAVDLSARVLELSPTFMTFALNIARSLLIVAVAVFILRLVTVLIISHRRLHQLTGITIDEALLPFIRTGITLVVIAIMMVIVLQVWGYDVTGLVAGLGLGGLAFSLAAQDLLSNLFGFAAVVSDRPFVVGDTIKALDIEGVVEQVGIRSTRIRQGDQAVVYVPNSKLASGTIVNWSRLSKRQIDLNLTINVAVRADQLEALVTAIREMLTHRSAVDAHSVAVHVTMFSNNSFTLLVRCYVRQPGWAAFTAEKEDVLLEVMRLMERFGITAPLPDPPAPLHQGSTPTSLPR